MIYLLECFDPDTRDWDVMFSYGYYQEFRQASEMWSLLNRRMYDKYRKNPENGWPFDDWYRSRPDGVVRVRQVSLGGTEPIPEVAEAAWS